VSFKVIKNFLKQEEADYIESTMLSFTFPWFYSGAVNTKEDNDRFFFSHSIIHEGNINSTFYDDIASPILKILKPNKINRIKCNLFVKQHEQIKAGLHTDMQEKHMVLLYYVNTNNGFTLFENGDKVPSIKNTALIFNGKLKHAAVLQTDEKVRINININYL
jgi:hypothetical protein